MKRTLKLTSPVDVTVMNTQITRLVHCNKFVEVENLLRSLPNSPEYPENEEIIRARIALAWYKKDVQAVYKLIEEGNFSNGDDLIEIWDQAHVYEANATTPVQRFRLRQRFPPPRSICPAGVRKKRGIPKETCDALQAWFMQHIDNPYPDSTERLMLAEQHGITLAQVKTWFANTRRRLRNSTTKCPMNFRQRRRRRKTKKDVVKSEESSTALSLNEAQAVEQAQRFDIADKTPQVMWNSFRVDFTGMSLVNGVPHPQLAAPFVPVHVSSPYQLSWLPAVHAAAFPFSRFSGQPLYCSNTWSGNEEVAPTVWDEHMS